MRAVAIGAFDGVHLGHKEVIERAISYARRKGLKSSVITFVPHPARFFKGESFKLLTVDQEKEELLRSIGVDEIIKLRFDANLASMPAEDFFKEILVKRLGVRFISVGFNFTFGRKGEGNVLLLRKLAREHRVRLEVVPPCVIMGRIVSSTAIRKLISEGKIGEGAILLGRNYSLHGRVVRGDGLGRRLGFPTANLSIPPEKLLPPAGVYATIVYCGRDAFLSAMNIGFRPTVSQGRRLAVEVHLIDFDGDLYDKVISVEILRRIRGEKKFSSEKELKEQIERDINWILKHYASIFSDSSTRRANFS